MKHLISLKQISKQDITGMIALAKELKTKRNKNESTNYLPNKTLLMLFQKNSTRTRISFETAMTELGGHAVFIDMKTTHFSLTDFSDEIQAIMRLGHILMFRAMQAKDVIKAASFNRIPVIDGCSEKYHPAQALSDIFTMDEKSNGIQNVKKIVWLGIENNVMNTLMLACTKLGIQFTIIAPEKDCSSIDEELNSQAKSTGLITRTLDLQNGCKNADYIHTDTWMNMEFLQNSQIKRSTKINFEKKQKTLMPYQLNAKTVDKYCPQAKIMHCMPCHVKHEISRDAIDHPNSIIFQQAENRLHMQKAIIMWLLNHERAKQI